MPPPPPPPPQHRFDFFPLPQGQGSLRPTFGASRTKGGLIPLSTSRTWIGATREPFITRVPAVIRLMV